MNIAHISLRNLNRQKKRSFLLAAAVAFGIMIITLLNGFVNGAVRISRDNIAQLAGGHIYLSIQRLDGEKAINYIGDGTTLLSAARQLGIADQDILRRSDMMGEIIFNGRTSNQQISGVNWAEETELRENIKLVEGSLEDVMADPLGAVLNAKVTSKLNAAVGDEILIRTETVTGQQNVGAFIIRAISEDTGLFGGLFGYAHRKYVNSLLNIPDESYQSMTLKLPNPDLVPMYEAVLRSELAKTYVVKAPDPPMSDQSFVMQAPKKEVWEGERVTVDTILAFSAQLDTLAQGINIVGLVVLVMMLLITMIGVINTFRMIMYERIQEIGTMRAMGMQRKIVGRIMLFEALFLALGGVLLGTALALTVMAIMSLVDFGTGSVLAIFLQSGHLSFSIDPFSVVFNTVLVSGITLLAAIFPARKASRLQPAQALRATY